MLVFALATTGVWLIASAGASGDSAGREFPPSTASPGERPSQAAIATSSLATRSDLSPSQPPTATPEADANVALTQEASAELECASSSGEADLLAVVDKKNGLERDYAPADLVELELNFRNSYYGLPTLVRQPAVEPLLSLLEAMNAADLRPKVISAYRSYGEQAVAYEKWLNFDPERGPNLSAPPGYSEHQLGTAVDFGSPELEYRFHTRFGQTAEGQWLHQHAAEYGFTLSYPDWAVEQTGYEWEPWHYRYVGRELAQQLTARGLTLSAYLAECASKGDE